MGHAHHGSSSPKHIIEPTSSSESEAGSASLQRKRKRADGQVRSYDEEMVLKSEARRNKKREKAEEAAKKQLEKELMHKYQEDDDITPKKGI